MQKIIVYVMVMGIAMTLGFFASNGFAHSGATGIVKERMDRFKASQDAMKAMANAVTLEDFDRLVEYAEGLETWANEMVSYFPEGSNEKPSEALDVIWEKPEEFAAMAARNAEAARRLMALAEDEDAQSVRSAFKDLAASCKSCHQQFRQ